MGTLISALVLAQEEHADEGGGGLELILPAVDELVWGTITFAVVLFVLNKFAFPKLREAVEAREKRIQADLEEAERAKAEAQRTQEEYNRQLAEARSEANRIIEEGRQQAEQVRKDLIAKAEKDAEAIVARAQEQLSAERNRTVQELQGQIAQMSLDLAEKVVGRSLDRDAQRQLVDAYISEVTEMPVGDGRGA